MKIFKGAFVALVMVLFVVTGFNSIFGGGSSRSVPEVSRCQAAPTVLVEEIASELKIQGGGAIANMQAVKSNDHPNVYFVSGDLQGPGLEGSGDIATFATNKLDGTGVIFSVGAVAEEFSTWPQGPVTITDDGVSESKKCLR